MNAIEWTDETWNPTIGCSRVSKGCENCYAERQAARIIRFGKDSPYQGLLSRHGAWNGKVRFLPERLDQPRRWARKRMIFVNSMSDLFHESIPVRCIDAICRVMEEADQHIYQVLTKRPEAMAGYLSARPWAQALTHVWWGVSAEDAQTWHERTAILRGMETAGVRWVSAEPLLGPVAGEQVPRRTGAANPGQPR